MQVDRVSTGGMSGWVRRWWPWIIAEEAQCGKWNDSATAAGAGTFRASQIGELRKGTRDINWSGEFGCGVG